MIGNREVLTEEKLEKQMLHLCLKHDVTWVCAPSTAIDLCAAVGPRQGRANEMYPWSAQEGRQWYN